MKFYPNQLDSKLFSQQKYFFKQILNKKKKKSYKKINNFNINFTQNIVQETTPKGNNNTTLQSYKELVKSFLIKSGKSKKLQNLTFKSLLNLWKRYPNFSLRNNINRFFFLYPFPLILKTTYPIFKKRRSKRSKENVQWLNSISERKYIFNFFKDFLKRDLTRNFGNNFVLTFMQLSSKRVSLLKTQQNMSNQLYDFWKRASRIRKFKTIFKEGNLNKRLKYKEYEKRALLYSKIKPFQTRFFKNNQPRGNFLSLNFLPGFPKKKIWSRNFFLNNFLFNIKIKEGILFEKSLNFLLRKKKSKSIVELQKLKKSFIKVNFEKKKKSFSLWSLNNKGKKLLKIKYLKKIKHFRSLKQQLRYKRKRHFYNWGINRANISKSVYINKRQLGTNCKTWTNKLFYNFLIRKYTFTEKELVKKFNYSWYFSIKKNLLFTIVTFDKKSLHNMDEIFNKVHKTFFYLDSVLFKTYPLKKTIKLQTLLKSPHVNKKAQQHFSKIEYSKTYSFTFDSKKISIEKIHLLLNRLITLNFINIKFKIHYSYK